jgi:hypothetical protein
VTRIDLKVSNITLRFEPHHIGAWIGQSLAYPRHAKNAGQLELSSPTRGALIGLARSRQIAARSHEGLNRIGGSARRLLGSVRPQYRRTVRPELVKSNS